MKLTSQRKFEARLGKAFCYCGDSPDPPDYTPVANASKESAEIMAKLGQEQLDFAKQQYAENKPILQAVADKQIALQDETLKQGKDYYDYQVSQQRPVEEALNADAMQAGSEAAQEAAAGRAAADVRQGTTQQQNQLIRQGLRYGLSPAKIAAMGTSAAAQAGLAEASAMNAAREKEKTLGYAKKMDVAGLYRGLAGASQGAYGVALNAGNSAGVNTRAPGQDAAAGMSAGAATVAQGRSLYQQGLGQVLGAQTSIYNNSQNSGLDVGGLLQGGAALAKAGVFSGAAFSDRRLKENIEPVGEGPLGLTLYEFNYIGDDRTFIGVMADEVERVMPDAVFEDDTGYKAVNYGMLGIEMVEVE